MDLVRAGCSVSNFQHAALGMLRSAAVPEVAVAAVVVVAADSTILFLYLCIKICNMIFLIQKEQSEYMMKNPPLTPDPYSL